MMRVLQACESLRHVTEIAAGNGLIKEHERESIMREWRRAAVIDEPGKQTTLGSLVGNGIGLRVIHKGEVQPSPKN